MKKLVFILLILVSCNYNEKRREEYVKRHPFLDAETKAYILAGRLKIGMSKEQVKAVLGYPHEETKMYLPGMVIDHWIYKYWGQKFLFFENGILTAWQEE